MEQVGGAVYKNLSYYNQRNGTIGIKNGQNGGDGSTVTGVTSYLAGSGAGNPAGIEKSYGFGDQNDYKTVLGSAENGCGGLLIIYSNNIKNNGQITSNGSKGGEKTVGGGSSGGGSINIFYVGDYNNTGTILVDGGIAVGTSIKGGAGGNGSISVGNISTGTYENTYKNY